MLPFIGPLITAVSGFFQNKAKLAQARVDGQVAVMTQAAKSTADWVSLMARGTIKSWKDEYVLILLSAPYILAFIPGGAQYAHAGFLELDLMPDWYTYTLVTIFLASYGIKMTDALKGRFLK
jgi:hypothetical protein